MLIALLAGQILWWLLLICCCFNYKSKINEADHEISLVRSRMVDLECFMNNQKYRNNDYKEELIKSQKMLNAIIEHLGCDIEKIEAIPDGYKLIKK